MKQNISGTNYLRSGKNIYAVIILTSAIVLILAGAGLVRAETPVFSEDFSTNPDTNGLWHIYRYGNTASWDQTEQVLYLTQNTGSSSSAMFASYQLKDTRWAAQFRYKVGGGINSGADGFVFMFYKDEAPLGLPEAYPCGAEYLGFHPCVINKWPPGNSVGYGIEFDGWYSGGRDPNTTQNNHIALIDTTTSNHLTYFDDLGLLTEDNKWHTVRVEFDNGHVVVSVDGQIVLNHNITNPNYAYSGVGFSAGTGLGTNNHVIDDFVLLGTGDPTGAAIPVSSCTNIASPGTYELTANIVNSSSISCIQITSSNVIFNGNNHTIDGIDAENSYGVNVDNPSVIINVDNPTVTTLTNVTVKNLIITDWVNGIKYTKVTNGRIEENNVNSNTVGIQLLSSNNNILKNNIATMTPFGGCGIGIYYSNFNTLTGNRANNNGGTGIILDGPSNYNTLVGNNASLNGDMGIWILGTSNHNDLTKNIVSGNGFCCGGGRAGIAISSSNYNNLTRNTIKKNLRGVAIGSSVNIRLANNVIKSNTQSGLDIVLSSVIIK